MYLTDLLSEHSNMAFISSLPSARDRASAVNIKISDVYEFKIHL